MPAYLITVYAGQSLAAGHWAEAVLAFVVLAIASVAGYFTSESDAGSTRPAEGDRSGSAITR